MAEPKKVTPLWKKSNFVPGRPPKRIDSALDLYIAAVAYFEYIDESNEIIAQEVKITKENPTGEGKVPKKGKETKYKYGLKPYIVSGLCVHMGVNEHYFLKYKQNALARIANPKTKPEVKENLTEILDCFDWIRSVIDTQIFDGGMIGKFNPNLAARYLGMQEKIQADLSNSDGSLKANIVVRDKKTEEGLTSLISKLENNNKIDVDEGRD